MNKELILKAVLDEDNNVDIKLLAEELSDASIDQLDEFMIYLTSLGLDTKDSKREKRYVDSVTSYMKSVSTEKRIDSKKEILLSEGIRDQKKVLFNLCMDYDSSIDEIILMILKFKDSDKYDILEESYKQNGRNRKKLDNLVLSLNKVKSENKLNPKTQKTKDKYKDRRADILREINLYSLKFRSLIDIAERIECTSDEKLKVNMEIMQANHKIQHYIQKLISSNLKLVIAFAKKYTNRGLDFADLIQEGNLGLAHASEKYDSRKGFKFSTYATHWVKMYLGKSIKEKTRDIKIPSNVLEVKRKAKKVITREALAGKKVSNKEISKELKISEEKIVQALEDTLAATSLDQTLGEDGSFHDLIQDRGALSPDFSIEEKEKEQTVDRALREVLSEREVGIIKMRYGIGYEHKMTESTLEEVGERYQLTRERVRQIQNSALEKLKNSDKLSMLV